MKLRLGIKTHNPPVGVRIPLPDWKGGKGLKVGAGIISIRWTCRFQPNSGKAAYFYVAFLRCFLSHYLLWVNDGIFIIKFPVLRVVHGISHLAGSAADAAGRPLRSER